MPSKAELIRDRDNYREWYNSAWNSVREASQVRYDAEKEHHRQIHQIMDVLGFSTDYRLSKQADGSLDVTGVDSFLADIAAAATAIESAAAKSRLGIK